MNISVIPAIRADKPRKDNTCAILIRIIYDRKVVATKSISKYVTEKDWDDARRCVRKSHVNAAVLNAAIVMRIAEIQKLLYKFEIEEKPVTVAAIRNLLEGKDVGADYFQFCLQHIPVKYCNEGQHQTRRSYYGELTKLKNFKSQVNFYDINYNFLQQYRAHMVATLLNHPNTVWKSFKFMKTMINDAIKCDVFGGENPFKKFDSGKYQQGKRSYLEIEDCREIYKVLQSPLPDMLKNVGYYYLLMCYTGMRFGDAVNLFKYELHVINDERICIKTQKMGVEINIFIHELLRPILDYVRHHSLVLCNKEFNKYLQVLAKMANVSIHLTAHVGRHTFGALLAEMETPKEVAQKLMGHNDIRSTNIYYHLKDKSLDNAMKGFNSL